MSPTEMRNRTHTHFVRFNFFVCQVKFFKIKCQVNRNNMDFRSRFRSHFHSIEWLLSLLLFVHPLRSCKATTKQWLLMEFNNLLSVRSHKYKMYGFFYCRLHAQSRCALY